MCYNFNFTKQVCVEETQKHSRKIRQNETESAGAADFRRKFRRKHEQPRQPGANRDSGDEIRRAEIWRIRSHVGDNGGNGGNIGTAGAVVVRTECCDFGVGKKQSFQ